MGLKQALEPSMVVANQVILDQAKTLGKLYHTTIKHQPPSRQRGIQRGMPTTCENQVGSKYLSSGTKHLLHVLARRTDRFEQRWVVDVERGQSLEEPEPPGGEPHVGVLTQLRSVVRPPDFGP